MKKQVETSILRFFFYQKLFRRIAYNLSIKENENKHFSFNMNIIRRRKTKKRTEHRNIQGSNLKSRYRIEHFIQSPRLITFCFLFSFSFLRFKNYMKFHCNDGIHKFELAIIKKKSYIDNTRARNEITHVYQIIRVNL